MASTHKTPRKPRLQHLQALRLALLAITLLSLPSCIQAQGCAQCRDNAAATPPATQAAYRHVITLMVITAGSIFLAAVFLLRKHDHK